MKITVKSNKLKYSVKMSDDTDFMDFMNVVNEISKIIYSSDEVNDYWE